MQGNFRVLCECVEISRLLFKNVQKFSSCNWNVKKNGSNFFPVRLTNILNGAPLALPPPPNQTPPPSPPESNPVPWHHLCDGKKDPKRCGEHLLTHLTQYILGGLEAPNLKHCLI